MKYSFELIVTSGEHRDFTGTITGTLDETIAYPEQLGMIEKQIAGWSSWVGVSRSTVDPSKKRLRELLTYWQEHKEDADPAKSEIVKKNVPTSEQTSLFSDV